MQLEAINAKLRDFLASHFPLARKVSNDDRLLGSGVLDSLGVLEVVTFVEREFGVTVNDEELVPENFESVSKLAAFVKNKMNGATPVR